jgi:exonuclease SbcC
MRVRSIEVEGLWAYRDAQRIDITGETLVVGVGVNGAGKSMLLVQALLVAFYGKFPTKTIAESITDGSTQGRVSVEFEVNQVGYRVGRTYPRKGTASGLILVEDSTKKTGWRPLTEKGIREIDAYLVGLLGMNHETATMTWIAEQGQYGKFAGADPSKRFALLSSIFGLDSYALKAAAANARTKNADVTITRLDGRAEELAVALEEPDVDDTAATPRTDEELVAETEHLSAEIDRVGLALAELGALDPARQSVEARQAYELVRNDRVSRLQNAEQTLTRATAQKTSAATRLETETTAISSRFLTTVTAARDRETVVKTESATRRRNALTALTSIATAQRELPELNDQITAHRDEESRHRAEGVTAGAAAAEARTTVTILQSEWAALQVCVTDAETRVGTLSRNTHDDDSECFTCGQHLTAVDSLALIELQTADIKVSRLRQDETRALGETAKQEAVDAEDAQKLSNTEAVNHSRSAENLLLDVATAKALIATKPAQETVEATVLAAMVTASKETQTIERTAATDRDTAQTAADLEAETANSSADTDILTATTIIDTTSNPSQQETKLHETLVDAEALTAGATADFDSKRENLTDERNTLRRQEQTIATEIGRRAEQTGYRLEQQKRLDAVTAERATAVTERTTYQTLAKAFSPAGIPAMILTGVIEQLNETVNTALTRLSNGELAVQMRTTRETAKGTSETKVTVYVETPTGVRAYESLSGGQKFRVDVAIRTGLAQTVARGTGTPIETFVLDEGWGTLDESGIRSTIDTMFRLSETVNVLTVSHIDAVRDAFPTRVEVTMSGGNSQAQVIHN